MRGSRWTRPSVACRISPLTRSDNQVVRLGALFTMSSPYFLYDTGWAQTARDRIVKEFPDTELALEAQRLPLYRAEQFGPDGLDLLFNAANQKDELRAHSQRLREDAIGAAVYNNLEARGGARDDAALADPLAAAAASAPGWMEQYAALSILADLDTNRAGARVRDAATAAIARDADPRVTFRARTLRLLLARKSGDAATLLEDTGALLDLGDAPRAGAQQLRRVDAPCAPERGAARGARKGGRGPGASPAAGGSRARIGARRRS